MQSSLPEWEHYPKTEVFCELNVNFEIARQFDSQSESSVSVGLTISRFPKVFELTDPLCYYSPRSSAKIVLG